MDRIKEIVDRLHWYMQDGDMLVDFCCGSNDFSWAMKEKLEEMGKKCSFKNYDLITPKNDFNFEKRDWMSVKLGELPTGSRLVMGLNPPFGVQASLANKFINEALKFKPKLLILIVPKETERLDEKNPPYDIIWEDDVLLSGKSFYLPGSVDVQNQQLDQWNLEPPPLYLWSRPDWTAKHRDIALKHGHLYKEQQGMFAERNNVEPVLSNYLMEEDQDCFGDFSNIINSYGDLSSILDDVPEDLGFAETEEARAVIPNVQINGRLPNGGHGECLNYERSRLFTEDLDVMHCEGKSEMNQNHGSHAGFDSEGFFQSVDMCMDMELSSPTNSPRNNEILQNAFGDNSASALEIPPGFDTMEQGFHPFQPNVPGHGHRIENYSGFYTTGTNAAQTYYGQVNGVFPTWSNNTSTISMADPSRMKD